MRLHPLWGSISCPHPYDESGDGDLMWGVEDVEIPQVPYGLAAEIDRLVLTHARLDACCGGVRHHTDECPLGPTADDLACMAHAPLHGEVA